jgi:hypothetical protein
MSQIFLDRQWRMKNPRQSITIHCLIALICVGMFFHIAVAFDNSGLVTIFIATAALYVLLHVAMTCLFFAMTGFDT